LIIDSFYTRKLQTALLSLGMKQYVNGPTRITKGSQTIIDLVFANNKIEIQLIYEPKITDYVWLKIELSVSKSESKYREFSTKNYSEFNINEIY